jgi:ABC-2 type transport system permease protein
MTEKIFIIAYYTFKELFKSRILYGIILIGLAIMLSVFIAQEFTYGTPLRVALDVGLGLTSLSSIGIALFLGVSLLSKEIESRTVYMIISRPIYRYQFILGKLLGLIGILIVNIVILTSMMIASIVFLEGGIDQIFFWSVFFILLESLLVLLMVTFFSLLTNNIMASFFSFVLLVSGHVISDTKDIVFVKNSPFLGKVLDLYQYVLPSFYKLNIKDFVLYKQSLAADYLISATIYGLAYSAFLLCLIILVFNRKNLD